MDQAEKRAVSQHFNIYLLLLSKPLLILRFAILQGMFLNHNPAWLI